jgi:hypothetical protein
VIGTQPELHQVLDFHDQWLRLKNAELFFHAKVIYQLTQEIIDVIRVLQLVDNVSFRFSFLNPVLTSPTQNLVHLGNVFNDLRDNFSVFALSQNKNHSIYVH